MKTVSKEGRTIKIVEPEELKNCLGRQVCLNGMVYKIRRMSGFAFVLLRTKRSVVQCIYSEEYSSFSLEMLREESAVCITARVIAEERSKTGVELQLLEAEVLSHPEELSPIVINNKCIEASLEHRLNYRPITLRNEKERAVFKLQEGICRAFREFLYGERFTEVHTPKIVAEGAEGGANIFRLEYFGK